MRRFPESGTDGPISAHEPVGAEDPPGARPGAAPDAPSAADLRLLAPLLETLAAQLPPAQALVLAGPAGEVRWLGGDPAAVADLAAAGVRPGARCLPLPDRPPLALVGAEPRRPAWACASAAAGSAGAVHVAARGTAGVLAGVAAIGRALAERLLAAQAVREQVAAFALRAAAPGEALVALDGDGRVLDASAAGRRWLDEAGALPAALAPDLAALERDPALASLELTPAAPGAPRVVVTPLRHGPHVVGAVVRLVPVPAPAALPARAPTPRGPGPSTRYALGQILGGSRAVGLALDLARTAARNDLPVVLLGESGTGKELFAQAIHGLSPRAGGPFVAVNCGCIPPTLLEAELFGYEAGTFTGGRREGNAGKFELAHRGTIFLDEVGELPAQAQAALLRVLQEREVVRLGGSTPRRIDLRVVAATNRSLGDDVRTGRFRADLYFRLAVLPIEIPPLRDRREDVPLLARAFLAEAEAELGRGGLSLSGAALAALAAYPWPGNVRELRNVILRTAAVAAAPVLDAADLPREVLAGEPAPGPAAAAAAPVRRLAGQDPSPDRESLLRSLEAGGWNVARTAQALHVSRMTLYRWLRKHQIAR